MHTNVILTNRRRIHTKPNYTNTKLKAWFRCLLRHPARKRSGSILSWHTPDPHRGVVHTLIISFKKRYPERQCARKLSKIIINKRKQLIPL